MQASNQCPRCGLDLGEFVETHCPQCGVSLAPKSPVTAGVWLLDLMCGIFATLFVLGCFFGFFLYMNTSSLADLYAGQPYHVTTFRVMSVQYSQTYDPPLSWAYAFGMIEGHKETMDVWPYVVKLPDFHNGRPMNQLALMNLVPAGTVIPVYLFPNLNGVNRIQVILTTPTAEHYRRLAVWTSSRALPVVGLCGILAVLLGFARVGLSRMEAMSRRL
jgi:hypothetical protein